MCFGHHEGILNFELAKTQNTNDTTMEKINIEGRKETREKRKNSVKFYMGKINPKFISEDKRKVGVKFVSIS